MSDRHFEIDYLAPSSLEEAHQRRMEIEKDVLAIQLQLGNRNQTNSLGQRVSGHEYWQWRSKAKNALFCKLEEQRRVKQFIAERSKPTTNNSVQERERFQKLVARGMLFLIESDQDESCKDQLVSDLLSLISDLSSSEK